MSSNQFHRRHAVISCKLLLFSFITIILTSQPFTASPLESPPDQLPVPSPLAGPKPPLSSQLEKNICEHVGGRIFFCNCDNYERPVDVTCFTTTGGGSSPLHPDWLDFAGDSGNRKFLSTVTTFKLTAFNGQQFSYLPLSALYHLRPSLVKLTVSDLQLQTLTSGAISSFPELEEVEFQLCSNMTLQEKPFKDLPKLRKVAISDANIGNLKRIFENVPSLDEVYLTKNGIESLPQDPETSAFLGMESCVYLELDQNAIEKVSRGSFKGLKRYF